jgi:hypothetical protein
MLSANLTPFVPRSKFDNITKPELVIWSGGEILRGDEAPSLCTPLSSQIYPWVIYNDSGWRGAGVRFTGHQPSLSERDQ